MTKLFQSKHIWSKIVPAIAVTIQIQLFEFKKKIKINRSHLNKDLVQNINKNERIYSC